MPPSAALITADELLHTPIPDKRVELVRGVLVVREPAGSTHGLVARLVWVVDPERRLAPFIVTTAARPS